MAPKCKHCDYPENHAAHTPPFDAPFYTGRSYPRVAGQSHQFEYESNIAPFPNEADKAGPCGVCGQPINHPIHAPDGFGMGKARGNVGDVVADHPATYHRWQRADVPVSVAPPDNEQRETTARDLVECLKMWDYTRSEAEDILRRARRLTRDADTWNNTLKAQGLKVAPGTPFKD